MWLRRYIRRRAVAVIALCAATVMGAHWSMGPVFYSAAPISGRVVDAASSQPVRNAIVIAQWRLQVFGKGEPVTVLHDEETLTDEDGRYQVAPWGPRLRLPFTRLTTEDPRIAVYCEGYDAALVDNTPAYDDVIAPARGVAAEESRRSREYSRRFARRFSYWNSRNIALTRSSDERSEFLGIVTMWSVLHAGGDDYPMARARLNERTRHISQGSETN